MSTAGPRASPGRPRPRHRLFLQEPPVNVSLSRRCLIAAVVALAATLMSLGAPASAATTKTAEELGYHPNLVLVRFADGVSAAHRAAQYAALGGVVANRLEYADLDVVRLPDGIDPAAASAVLG